MKLFSILTLFLTSGSALVANPRDVESNGLKPRFTIPEGYTVSEMTWTGPVVEGGPEHTFSGTAEKIIHQIQKVNPDYKLVTGSDVTNSSAAELETRGMSGRICSAGRIGAYGGLETLEDDAKREINYLLSLGRAQCGVAARSCVRVSCSWDSAIWWCNDRTNFANSNCDYLGIMADAVVQNCRRHVKTNCWVGNPFCGDCGCNPIDDWMVWGQQFDDANFNVIVTADDC